MLDVTDIEHLAQEFGNLDGSSTDEDRTALVNHRHNFLDDGIVFLAFGAVNTVVHVVAGNRFIGRDYDYVQFVDIPELARLGLGCTGHTSKFVIHTEIVLQGNGSERLRCAFNLHVLLGFHSLVQTVRPAAALHDTARLLVHDLHLAAVDDVIHIFLEEGVGFEELIHRMNALRFDAVIGKDIVLTLLFFFGRQALHILEFRHFGTYVRQHEEIGVIGCTGEGINTLVGQLDGLILLINNEIEFVGSDVHILLVLLEIELFGLLQAHFDTGFGQIFDECFGFRQTFECTEEG